jgi:hypothetical protein
MPILIVLSWVIWAASIYLRRKNSAPYQDKWQQNFCRRQRARSGQD